MEGSHRHIHARPEDRRCKGIPNTVYPYNVIYRKQIEQLSAAKLSLRIRHILHTRHDKTVVRRVFLSDTPRDLGYSHLPCSHPTEPSNTAMTHRRNSGPKTTGEFQVERLFETYDTKAAFSSSVIT